MQRRNTERESTPARGESVPRREALTREQIDAQARQAARPRLPRSRFPQRLIPLLVFAAVAVFIAREEVPAFGDWWERTFAPGDWQLKQTCREAALEMSDKRAFTRIVKAGEVHATQEGFYVEGLVLGEMGQDGGEQRTEYTCYLEVSRRLVRVNRLDGRAPSAAVP